MSSSRHRSITSSHRVGVTAEGNTGWEPGRIAGFRTALRRYFLEEARELPWRGASDPYRILVSEIMLQQTRVETVRPYFERWMERFPTLQALAVAEEDEVLRLWAGLGYYSRARNLQGAARVVIREHEGFLPRSPRELESLPGVGRYTAGAVASIAFGVPAPAVDGNVRRALSRLMDDPAPSPATLNRWAGELVDPEAPGDFNQALMELGSRICAPRAPSCHRCPVRGFCRASEAGTQEDRPARRPRRPVPRSEEAVLAVVRGSGEAARALLRRRPRDGLLGGMWELPGREASEAEEARSVALELAATLLRRWGGVAGPAPEPVVVALPPLDHAFTHRRIRYRPFRLSIPEEDALPLRSEGWRWAGAREAEQLPLPAAQRKLLSRVWC